jgi:toxin ParE1/3/4
VTRYTVVYSKRARQNLRSIERYVARKASAREASAYVERIVRRCDRIALAPFQGEQLEHLRPGLRKTGMEGTITVLFRVDAPLVTILSIAYHGRRYESDFDAVKP